MSFREWVQLIDGLCGLSLEEWKVVQEEVNQHFGMKCMRVCLDEADAKEITRLVAMPMDMYDNAVDAAPKQTRMSI